MKKYIDPELTVISFDVYDNTNFDGGSGTFTIHGGNGFDDPEDLSLFPEDEGF